MLLPFVPSVPRSLSGAGRSRGGAGRGGLVVALALLGAVAFFGVRNARRGAPEPTLAERYAADDRIAPLLHGCSFGKLFQGDTSAMGEILVAKLGVGAQLEPLRRAKQELATFGPEVEPTLRRLYEQTSREQFLIPVALNVLEVCALAEQPWGLSIGALGLVSPREDVRTKASYVFKKHGRPEDYETVRAAFLSSRNPETAQTFVDALVTCDAGLFHFQASDLVDRFRTEPGGLALSDLADTIAMACATAVDPVAVDMLYERSAGLAPRQRAYMIAPSAGQPDSTYHHAALDELRGYLTDPLVGPRLNAAQALVLAGRADEVLRMVELDEDPNVRARAVSYVSKAIEAGRIPADLARPVLRAGLQDPELAVQSGCLSLLLELGDETAWAEAMRGLEASIADRDIVIRALRDRWDSFPVAAHDQARARLVRLVERQPVGDRPTAELISLLRAIGSIPGRASGEFLLDTAGKLKGQSISGLDGHRWSVGQAYNAGPEAREVIRERLFTETDPFLRLDLIAFVWQEEDPAAVDVLCELVQDDTRDPHERLFVADRLVNMKASKQVAPVLKDVYWRSTDPLLRPGLQCILWIWYGVDQP